MNKTILSKNTGIFLRGIGVLFVVIAHYAQWYTANVDSNIVWLLLSKIGRYGVAVFFVVSGYGLVFSAEKGLDGKWIKRRLMNVYLPYLAIEAVIHCIEKMQWNSTKILRYILGMDAWFVFVIMLFYILFWIVWKYSVHKICWMAIGITVISILLAIFMKDSVWYTSNIAFFVGIATGKYNEKILVWLQNARRRYFCVFLITFLLTGAVYTFFTNRVEVIYIGGKILATLFWTLFLLAVFSEKKIEDYLINNIGKASLEIYLLHSFVLKRITYSYNDISPFFILFGSMVLSFTVGILINMGLQYLCRRKA